MFSTCRHQVACLICVVALAAPAAAQTFTGSITGTVTDPAGALVPNAALTLTNLDTNDARRQLTNESGEYTFAAVSPGRYRLALEHPGFKRVVQEPIEVRVQQFVTLDLALEVGQASQTVEVS